MGPRERVHRTYLRFVYLFYLIDIEEAREYPSEPNYHLHIAAEHGNLGLVKWLMDRGKVPSALTFAKAATGGSIDVCKLLREAGCPWDSRVGERAALRGHLYVLQWAIGNGLPWTDEMWMGAVRNARYEILLWAHRRGYAVPDGQVNQAVLEEYHSSPDNVLTTWVNRIGFRI